MREISYQTPVRVASKVAIMLAIDRHAPRRHALDHAIAPGPLVIWRWTSEIVRGSPHKGSPLVRRWAPPS